MNAKLVVKPHQPRRVRITWTIAALAVLVGGYGLFEIGRHKGGFAWLEASRERDELMAQIAGLQARNTDLRERIALLEASRNVDDEAYQRVETSLVDLQSQIQRQREELAFYRGIVSPEDGATGLRIQEFRLLQGPQETLFRVRLVLVQASRHDSRVSGVVSLSVDGVQDGAAASYDFGELAAAGDDAEPLEFSFRYFQDFEREVRLPEGFVPNRVTVEVNPKGRTAKVIRQSFDWSVKSS